MKVTSFAAVVCAAAVSLAATPKMKPVLTVPHELDVLIKAGHIQGACCSTQGVYLAHQLGIEKIGWDGRLIKHVDAPAHLGDIAYADGRIYGAFVIRDKNARKDGKQGLVRVWDENLNVLNEAWFDEALDGAVVLGDTVYVGIDRWGRKAHPLCCVKRLGLNLKDLGNTDIDLGYNISYGVQTMATDGKSLFFGCYGGTSLVNPDLKENEKVMLSCAEGFGLVPKSIAGDATVFFVVRALGGNMRGWRSDPENNPPCIRLDFYEWADGKFTNITDMGAPRAITYEEFGAVGDGKTDDRNAIIAAHEAANARGVPVRAKDGATYYIGCVGRSATIKTDVDFGTAKFILDDTKVPGKYITVPAFNIMPDAAPIPVTGIGPLAKGQKSLGVKLPGRCLVRLENSGVKRFIRYGKNQNNGSPQQEMVIVDGDGRIDPSTPLVWDYEKVTSAKAWPIDGRTITVKGGSFTTIANQAESRYTYYLRGFCVRRSNVRIEGLSNYVTGELDHGAPYSGFLRILECANVTVTGCVFTAHRTYETIGSAGLPVSMGTYGIGVGSAVNVSFIGCRQTTDILDNRYWGLFGSNYCRNLLFDNCEFSRFDAHTGVANATIRNSTLGHSGVQAIGFGTLLIENTTVRSSGSMIGLRSDYGSSWDGDIVIRNCKYAPIPGRRPEMSPLISGSNLGTHDYGYGCTMPRRIVIDGLEIDDSGWTGEKGETYIFAPFDRRCKGDGVRPYPVPEEVTLRNVHTVSGRPLKTSRNMDMFGKVKIVQSK